MSRPANVAALALFAVLLVGAGGRASPGEAEVDRGLATGGLAWSTFRGNPQRTGLSTSVGPEAPVLLWQGGVYQPNGEPVVGPRGRVYGRGISGLWTFDSAGKERWTRGGGSGATPSVGANGRVYVGLTYSPALNKGYSRFVALRADGTTLWRRAMGKNNGPSAAAIAADGTLYVTQKWGLLAVSPAGNVSWRRHALVGTPALGHDGTVYAFRRLAPDEYRLVAFTADGREKWTSDLRFSLSIWPVAVGADGTIFSTVRSSYGLTAVSSTGTLLWQARVRAYGPPSLGPDGSVYVVTSTGALRAYSSDGKLMWRRRVGVGLREPVSVDAAGTIYVPAPEKGYIVALNPDGSVKWRFQHGLPRKFGPTSSIAIADGRLYFYDRYRMWAVGDRNTQLDSAAHEATDPKKTDAPADVVRTPPLAADRPRSTGRPRASRRVA